MKEQRHLTYCRLGAAAVIEENVMLGHVSPRTTRIIKTVIGNNPVVRANTVIYTNTRIGNRFETGHGVVIREQNRIGDNVSIWNNSTIDYGCKIGHRVRIHCNVYLSQYTTVEDDAFLGPGVVTTNDPCPVCTKCMKGPTIKKRARIGAHVTILPHITIGESALIGAGSVVTRSIPPGCIAYGNPARVVGSVYDMPCKKGIVDKPYKRKR